MGNVPGPSVLLLVVLAKAGTAIGHWHTHKLNLQLDKLSLSSSQPTRSLSLAGDAPAPRGRYHVGTAGPSNFKIRFIINININININIDIKIKIEIPQQCSPPQGSLSPVKISRSFTTCKALEPPRLLGMSNITVTVAGFIFRLMARSSLLLPGAPAHSQARTSFGSDPRRLALGP